MITREDLIESSYHARVSRAEHNYRDKIAEIESALYEDAGRPVPMRSVSVQFSVISLLRGGNYMDHDLIWYIRNHGYHVSLGKESQRDQTVPLIITWG